MVIVGLMLIPSLLQTIQRDPLTQRCVTEENKQCFLSKIRETLPGAVINITHPPAPNKDLQAPLCELATEVSSKKEGNSEEDVIREFSEKLTFSESSKGS